ncbi:MAG: AAA family ATPase [Candidatus Paceibacterota bacterium]|jgi:chromosome segregation protein
MFLKRLEINGFKSFAAKTTFEFPSGIVGIVGPNGSGKSNVIDAVRWLLGEREAKNLRGDTIEDLIFAGTPKKPRVGMAQVSVVLDNASGKLPSEFKEIVITRRVTRAGVSQYLMNDSEVRLKDVVDFFSKAKLGTRGLTIISQGSADIFVRASAADRMMMVQEILGLREYQLKKAESERKLKNARINLDKVSAMMGEVAPRLRMLKRQTSRWEKRFEIEEDLRESEKLLYASKLGHLFVARTQAHSVDGGAIDEALVAHEKELAQADAHVHQIEDSSFSSDALKKLQEQKRDLFSKKSGLERSLFKIEADIDRVEQTTMDVDVSVGVLRSVLAEVKNILRDVSAETSIHGMRESIARALRAIDGMTKTPQTDQMRTATSALAQQKKEITATLAQLDQGIADIEKNEEMLSRGVQDFNVRFKEAFAQRERIGRMLQELRERKQRMIFEDEKIQFRIAETQRMIEAAGLSMVDIERVANEPAFEPVGDDSAMGDLERKVLHLRGDIASIGEIDQGVVQETQEVEAHYSFLEKQSADLEHAIADLDGLAQELGNKITTQFSLSFKRVNEEFNTFFRLMFGGGHAHMKVVYKERAPQLLEGGTPENQETSTQESEEILAGIDVELAIPQKKVMSLEALSGGEKSLVSIAALFALVSVSPPPFLILDEADSALDEKNSKRFADLIHTFASHTQFIVVTHNRVTMEAANVLYGVTMDEAGCSKVLSLRFADDAVVEQK